MSDAPDHPPAGPVGDAAQPAAGTRRPVDLFYLKCGLLLLIFILASLIFFIRFRPRLEKGWSTALEKIGWSGGARASAAGTLIPEAHLPPLPPVESGPKFEAVKISALHWNVPHRLAVIIDDMGNDLPSIQRLLAIDAPITFSVLPYMPYTEEAARLAHEHGREVMLHLPMEPLGYPARADPGEGGLLLSMAPAALTRTTEEDLAAVPYAVGVNNHMGSALSLRSDKLEAVMRPIARAGLFFIDSLTVPNSEAYRVAERCGIPSARRDLFLDHVQERAFIEKQFEEAMRMALGRGDVVVIGHPYPLTLGLLGELVPRAKARGVNIVPASALVR